MRNYRLDGRGAVHVSLHKMPAETPAGHQRQLEINAALAARGFQIRPVESFLQEIERQFIVAAGSDREAATIHGHAVANLHFSRESRGRDLQLFCFPVRPQRNDRAHFLNQAGKHLSRIAMNWPEANRLFAKRSLTPA